ncbi:trichohyalin-like [Phymastichus coffea]|uniref:trichohyalin-like n=1 Tax=Phymastichus coffea TaxID=108790 RepID=UPI00273AAB27|nr:trichohyalin-like [Phymastichus coffea]
MLPVTTDGEVLTKGKNYDKQLAVSEKNFLKEKEKFEKKKQELKKNKINNRLLKTKTIFDESSEEELDTQFTASSEINEIPSDQTKKTNNNVSDRPKRKKEKHRDSNYEWDLPSVTKKASMKKERQRERKQKLDQERERDQRLDQVQAKERDKDQDVDFCYFSDDNVSQFDLEKDRQSQELDQERELERERARELDRQQDQELDQELEEEDRLKECRRYRRGKVQICEDFENIWIDKSELTCLYRWKNKPKEMARRLLRILVGNKNLKNMCARGRSTKNKPIPEDIVACIEYYVNKKCPDGLTPAAFTTVANYMIGSLRHPKL